MEWIKVVKDDNICLQKCPHGKDPFVGSMGCKTCDEMRNYSIELDSVLCRLEKKHISHTETLINLNDTNHTKID